MGDAQDAPAGGDGLKNRTIGPSSTPSPPTAVFDDSQGKTRAKKRWSLFRTLLNLAALAFLFFTVVMLAWLYEPLKKAYRNTRSEDHESEKMFQKEDGCVRSLGATVLASFHSLPFSYPYRNILQNTGHLSLHP